MKPALIFVDDEPNILSGYRRMLHQFQADWEMTFCPSTAQAIKKLEEKNFDILICDILMPGMDGSQLLEHVFRRYPSMVRLVLTGHSDKKLAISAAKYAHQFLAKPTTAADLKQAIERILRLRAIVTNPNVRGVIDKVGTLPALSGTHQKIVLEIKGPNPSMQKVAKLISDDMGLTANIMKLVNSAFFGLKVKVSSPYHAVNLLGLDIISALVLNAQLFSNFDGDIYPEFSLDSLWLHCLHTGLFAKAIARHKGFSGQAQDDLYVAGLLHDVGKLALLCNGKEFYGQVLAACREKNSRIVNIEKEVLGSNHAELGAYLLCLWGLDEELVRCVFSHHALADYAGDNKAYAAILHVANCFEHDLRVQNAHYDSHPLDLEALQGLGLESELPDWRKACENALREVSESV